MRSKVMTLLAGAMVLLATPVFGQGRGQGVGGVAGGVTGAVGGTVNGAAGGTVQHPANLPVDTGKSAPVGHGAGASGNAAIHVTDNAGLSAQLQPLLPTGTTLANAAAGFENQGQFVSALHAAHNLNIPFDQLKSKMTGADSESLGKAIHSLRPALDAKAIKDDTKLAEHQADRDLNAKPDSKSNSVATHIASNSNLSARLESMLPSGMTLQSAAAGFKNEGQFIAALQVSKNLNIPFADLKDRVTADQSLGEAIHALKPDLSQATVASDVKQAQDQSVSIQAETSVSASATTKP
jgi:hypothetical protein